MSANFMGTNSRHPGESRDPGSKIFSKGRFKTWIPAFAGMTVLVILLAHSSLAETRAFPVPFVAKRDAHITFTNLPDSGSIKIFTIDGEEVVSLGIAPGELIKQWNVTNSKGSKVASGVYLYRIDSGNGSETQGKLVVIR